MVRSRYSMARSHSAGSAMRPACTSRRRMSAASSGMNAQTSPTAPCPSRARRWDAEAVPASGGPSCPAPMRGMVAAFRPFPCRAMARRYSTAKMLLGWASRDASTPDSVPSACCRAAAKVTPSSRLSRSARVKAGLSRPSAAARRAARSPDSEPNSSMSTTPVRASSDTPPSANRSAVAMAHSTGSSSTRSAPHRTAISARAALDTAAKLPRWVKLPLMAHTTADAPMARAWASRWACPRCRGSNSQMIPTFMAALLSFFLYFT